MLLTASMSPSRVGSCICSTAAMSVEAALQPSAVNCSSGFARGS